ncbi:MAG: O-antigen ligase family protein [Patescibacteria group bacterium]
MLTKFLKLRFDLVFFYLFVFLLPLEKKHVFIAKALDLSTNYSPWEAIEIYLTDIVFGLVLLFWLINLLVQNPISDHIEFEIAQHPTQRWTKLKLYKNPVFLLLSGFFLVAIISTIQEGITNLEVYHLTKLAEYFMIFIYTVLNIDTIVKLLYIIIIFIFSSFFQAILGILQYLSQHSYNLKIFGEVDLTPQAQNVAKIVVDGEKYIRAYGTLPHANILGGYLFVGSIFAFMLILLIILFFARNNEQNINNKPIFANKNPQKLFHVEQSLFFRLFRLYYNYLLVIFSFIFALLFLGLIFSFSRSAWLAFIFVIIFLLINFTKSFINFFKKDYKKIWPILILFVFITISLATFFPQIKAKTSHTDQYGDESVAGRFEYTKTSLKMVKKSPFFGIGYGNFTIKLAGFSQKPLQWWQFQPVHNIYLLILSETGILGLLFFLGFIGYVFYLGIKAIKNIGNSIQRLVIISFFAIFSGLIIIGFFDHYLWDIQQGSLLFWLISGISLSSLIQTSFKI